MRPCLPDLAMGFLPRWCGAAVVCGRRLRRSPLILSDRDAGSRILFGLSTSAVESLAVEPSGTVRRAHERSRQDAGETDLLGLRGQLHELLGPHPALDRVVT